VKEEHVKRYHLILGVALCLAFILALPAAGPAQEAKVRASLKAGVMQTLGTDAMIKIEYGRPGVKGRKIWGDLVPYGLTPGNKYSENKPYPWRAGANENTTFESNKDLLVEGKPLPAGKYSIHMIPGETEWVVIFNKNSSGWGSYAYKQEEDALRVTVKPVKTPFKEWMEFGFDDLAGTAATAYLQWVELKVPFKIQLAQ
jgi:hypothetical protein